MPVLVNFRRIGDWHDKSMDSGVCYSSIKIVLQSDGMIYFPKLRYSRNHLSKYEIENLFISTEYLYEDSHKSTLINCFARKQRVIK